MPLVTYPTGRPPIRARSEFVEAVRLWAEANALSLQDLAFLAFPDEKRSVSRLSDLLASRARPLPHTRAWFRRAQSLANLVGWPIRRDWFEPVRNSGLEPLEETEESDG